MRPTFFRSPAAITPSTTLRNTSGATMVWISRRKMSPRTFIETATGGAAKPSATPRTRAMTICVLGRRQSGCMGRGVKPACSILSCS
jgi:hypothetical protein